MRRWKLIRHTARRHTSKESISGPRSVIDQKIYIFRKIGRKRIAIPEATEQRRQIIIDVNKPSDSVTTTVILSRYH